MTTGISAAVVISAYLIGAIPFGLLIGFLNGKDVRKEGSCNIGATNVTRVVGKWWGKLCFLCDFLKGLLPALLTLRYLEDGGGVRLKSALSGNGLLVVENGNISIPD